MGKFARPLPGRNKTYGRALHSLAIENGRPTETQDHSMAVAAPLPAGGWESMRGLELADIALGAAAIILMFALLLVSMPGWQ